MKIQSLAVIFIILILPISLVLATYTKNRVETISLQATYDSKLNDATHDALKAYQVNSFKNDTAALVNSKIRDIEASVNTFFNSMSTNFSSLGYTKQTLQNYVPALVYTMYDGYYIYAPFTNTWSNVVNKNEQVTFKDRESIYGLKPYVYYSCRYKGTNFDIVITYSLDNYIQIQGMVGDKPVNKYGYVLNNLNVKDDVVSYNGVTIDAESPLKENVYVNENRKWRDKRIRIY